jgi:hypothetical protein
MNGRAMHRRRDSIRLKAIAETKTQRELPNTGVFGPLTDDLDSTFHISHKDGMKIGEIHIASLWQVV